MTETITHIDVGLTAQLAALTNEEPSTVILCGATDGDSIRDSLIAMQAVGGYPAACNCALCKRVAENLARGMELGPARKAVGVARRTEQREAA